MHGVITGLKVKDLFLVRKKRTIDFSPNLYYGEGLGSKDLEKLSDKLCTKPLLTNLFLLILPENPSDQVDILSSRYLAQPFYGEHPLKVVGIANSREDAISLIIQMTEDCLAVRKDCLLREFLQWQS
jgi:hypothetical protein